MQLENVIQFPKQYQPAETIEMSLAVIKFTILLGQVSGMINVLADHPDPIKQKQLSQIVAIIADHNLEYARAKFEELIDA